MGEPGPFICLGSMDGGDERCLRYCSSNPRNCRGVVPVGFGASREFQSYVDYYGGGHTKQMEMVKSTCAARKGAGNMINFLLVSWGLIAAIIPASPTYQPRERAFEHLFLNILNEKQWLTNANILAECPLELFYGYSDWAKPQEYPLPLSVPVFGFNMAISTEQLNKRCADWGYAVGSKVCRMCKTKRSAQYHAVYPEYANGRIYRALYVQCNSIEENAYD